MADNLVDNQTPLCTQANADNDTPEKPSPGVISYYGATASSVMEGNEQHATGGIIINAHSHTGFQSFIDVRANVIDGEYMWGNACSGGGIVTPLTAPSNIEATVASYGTSIDHNIISQSDGIWGGAIDYAQTGTMGTTAGSWRISDSNLVFKNTISEHGTAAVANSTYCGGSAYGSYTYSGRIGVNLIGHDSDSGFYHLPWRTVLYGNSCDVTTTDSSPAVPMDDNGTGTQRYCPSGAVAGSCECAGVATADVGIAASATAPSVTNGAAVTYNVTVTNNGASTATKLKIILEPRTGIQFTSSSLGASCTLQSNANDCALANLPSGQSVNATFTATAEEAGNWPVNFTVTHAEADSNPANDSAAVTVTVTP
jgi:uncharacterized repeat protein (TIGR01451 family)